MNRIDRLNAVLIFIQGKSRTSIEDLERRFEVSRRTIFRDIKSLMEAGVPIGGDAGEGYFIVEGYHLPPVVFNKEEAGALLLGEKFIEGNADQQTIALFQNAMAKVKAVLRYNDKAYLENLENKISIRPNPRNNAFPDSHLVEIQQAIATQKVLQVVYRAAYSDTATERHVEPLGLIYYSSRWHLIAYCRLREDMRDFRGDRIERARIVNEGFEPARHPHYLDFINELILGTESKEVILNCTPFIARVIGDQKYYWGFVEEEKVAYKVQMKFLTPSYEYFARWLMSYGDQVEIVSPSILQGLAATYAKELFEHHASYFRVGP